MALLPRIPVLKGFFFIVKTCGTVEKESVTVSLDMYYPGNLRWSALLFDLHVSSGSSCFTVSQGLEIDDSLKGLTLSEGG